MHKTNGGSSGVFKLEYFHEFNQNFRTEMRSILLIWKLY